MDPLRVLLAWRPDGDPDGDSTSTGTDTASFVSWLSRTAEISVKPVTVIPRIWPEGVDRVDAADADAVRRFEEWAAAESTACHAAARTALTEAGVPESMIDDSDELLHSHSETTALIRSAEEFSADLIVVGSRFGTSGGPVGRFRAGSTTDALLHCAPLPVLTVPRTPTLSKHGVTRVSCAYVDNEQSHQALRKAADLASRWGVPLRLVAFSPTGASMYPTLTPFPDAAEADERWRNQALDILGRGRERAEERHPDLRVSVEVGSGPGWSGAMDDVHWKKGEILVVGSSVLGAFNRVFIGPSTNQLLAHSPAPVLVSPV
ncbi:MAG: universal stress protein [Corynebacterium sp.]|uniref:universal stress protein n=1 Tax=unclassified Corynebacterium TaxID=2624378 RepID=UPI00264769DE|nr:universal stress protein [Corynebacterium sp.]MDN5720007.1 universal stress protein [Corynebacterium sp.]MDN6258203.1 universal stress protein [Corynebacterium sp.]MDN6323828.1 universal stress protein [Corynebacterium sp.]MDN6509162.1 universal stress protein [Corynebacterium sp.]